MRRAVLLALVVAMLAGAGTAVADDGFYMGLRLSGMGRTWLNPYWHGPYYDWDEDPAYPLYYLDRTDDGLFDYTEMCFGYRTGAMAGELSFGMSSSKWFEEWEDTRADNEYTEQVTWRTIGLTGLYTMIEPDPIELDLGLRFQLHSAKWTLELTGYSESDREEGASGWSIGPVIRARWYLGDGAFAIGPEIYPRYTSLSYKHDSSSYLEPSEATISDMGVEYSVRAEFFF